MFALTASSRAGLALTIPHAVGLALLLLAAIGSPALAQTRTFIALGDSYGFGFEVGDFREVGVGDRGYVRPYADWLGTAAGGGGTGGGTGGTGRPRVVNLSVPGETVGSFFTTEQIGSIFNTNYPFAGRVSQSELLARRVNDETIAGRTITHITISMGGNDLLALRGEAGFPSLPIDQQQQRVVQALSAMSAGYTSILSRVRGLLPSAELVVVGYFNPFPAVPGDAFAPISGFAVAEMNARIAQLAAATPSARFVDIAPQFVGREAALSYITAPAAGDNIHPNALGYAAIAAAIIPAPGAGLCVVMLGLGLSCGNLRRRH
jgi:lysophospholipase L1-like esterase